MKSPILVFFVAGLLLSGMIYSGTVQASGLEEEVTVTGGRTITPREESIISSAAIKALRHIAQARADIHEKNMTGAQNELKQVHILLDIIKAMEPTENIKDRIWIAKKHLSYENTETVMDDLVPIYASLDDIEDLVPVDKAKEHINNAKKSLENGNKKGAGEELTLADESLVYNEIALPRGNTKKHIINAQLLLSKKDAKGADAALKSAEDDIQFISVMTSFPVVQAKKGLWHAYKNYVAGELAATKGDLKKAKTSLEKVIKSGDDKSRAAAEKLMKDIEAVGGKVDNGAKETGDDIKNLYERAKALTHEAVNSSQTKGSQAAEGMEK